MADIFTLSAPDLAALLCSRLCHDIISPVGAINNGLELLDEGAPKTEFMRFGDRVKMEVYMPDGQSVFGAIDQKVVKA